MTLGITAVGPHPDQGALVRLVDGEGSEEELARLAAHVGTCAECQGERRLIAERSRGLSNLLARTDATSRTFALRFERRAPRAWWRAWPAAAAAALVVLSAAAVFANPMRTWVLGRWASVRRLLHAPQSTAPGQTPRRADSDTVGAVSFTPGSDVLVVRVATRQAEGLLLLEATAAGTASAMVRGAGDRQELIVLPDELRIANTAGSRATYRVTVPTRLKRVVVLIGAEPPVNVVPVLGDRRMLDLSVQDRR